MNEKLILHLIETKNALENGLLGFLPDHDKVKNYLYLATQAERMNIYMAEKSLNGVLRSNQFSRDLNTELDFELNRLKPFFEAQMKSKGLVTISNRPLKIEPTFENGLSRLRDSLLQIEQTNGSFIALLSLKHWAHTPHSFRGDQYRSRVAASYLRALIPYLMTLFQSCVDLMPFLDWCGNRNYILTWSCTRALPTKEWGFSKKELRSPPDSALPIHEAEAANYIKYFLDKAVDTGSNLCYQFAEMTIYLSLCLASGRNKNNYYTQTQILKVSHQDVTSLPKIKGIKYTSHTDIISDPWDLKCYVINIDKYPIISSRLAEALDLLRSFTINSDDVGNRLNDAYKVVGLPHSSGKICPRCFFFRPLTKKTMGIRK